MFIFFFQVMNAVSVRQSEFLSFANSLAAKATDLEVTDDSALSLHTAVTVYGESFFNIFSCAFEYA